MTVNESSEQSVNTASGDDLASEIRAVLTYIKSIGVRIASESIIRGRMRSIAFQNVEILLYEKIIRSEEACEPRTRLTKRISEQQTLIFDLGCRTDDQIWRMRCQSRRLSKLEIKLVEKIPPPYAKGNEKLLEENLEKITESNPKEASPPPAKAKSRRKGGRCQIS